MKEENSAPKRRQNTEEKEIKKQKEITKQAMKEAYEDLDSLIYTLTHELKSPAREIELYAEFIEEDNRDRLLPQSVKDIQSIRDTCQNIISLVRLMMDYSRVGFKVIEKKKIDMTLLIRQCFDEQVVAHDNQCVRLQTEILPEFYGDLFMIRLMLMNIISNSVKFTLGRENALIKVSSSFFDGGVEYCISDNGIGFDQKYADNLFEPFQRLQNEGAYEGNGIGLATVKKVVERFDGRVSIHGTLNKGCVVRVWFPEKYLYYTELAEFNREGNIKVGIVSDFTGVCSLNEQGKRAAYILAADEINAVGGILGRKVELLFRDDQGDTALTAMYAAELTEQEHVNVLMGSTLSPTRDMLISYANKNKTLYLNTQQTEGGVADHYTFCLSAMPKQQMLCMLEYLIKNYGKKFYIIAADYNFGILSAEWVKYFLHELGGELVGCEYLDDQISDFDALIDRIIKVDTDVLFSLCVYPNHDGFFMQWSQRGLSHIPNASTTCIAVNHQHVTLPPPVMENTYFMASFLEDLNTEPAREFVRKYRARFSKDTVPYMGMDTETAYSAMHIYKKACEAAGTTEVEAVISALENEDIYFDGPAGRVVVRGNDHHTARHMSCFRVDSDNRVHELFRTDAIHSDYVEKMIEIKLGVKGGMRNLGANALPVQYNMLLDKITPRAGSNSASHYL